MGVLKNDVGRPSKKTKIIRGVLKLIGILIIIALGLGVGYLIGNDKESDKKNDVKKDTNNINSENEKEIISRLYGYFENIPMSYSFEDFYTTSGILSDNISDEYMLSIAANNIEPGKCNGVYGDSDSDCYSKNSVLSKTEQIFGKRIELKDETCIFPNFSNYKYSAENSEFYHYADGSGSTGYLKNMYDYKIKNNRIYIYEVVVVDDFASDSYYDLHGNEIDLPKGITKENIIEYKDNLEKFKWTFAKKDDGNYIFEKVEKID